MYGQPINPKNAEFILFVDDGSSNNPMYIY